MNDGFYHHHCYYQLIFYDVFIMSVKDFTFIEDNVIEFNESLNFIIRAEVRLKVSKINIALETPEQVSKAHFQSPSWKEVNYRCSETRAWETLDCFREVQKKKKSEKQPLESVHGGADECNKMHCSETR